MIEEKNDVFCDVDLDFVAESMDLQIVDEIKDNDIELQNEYCDELSTCEITDQNELVEINLGCDEIEGAEVLKNETDIVAEELRIQGYEKLRGKSIEELEEYYNSIRCTRHVGVYVKTNAEGFITEIKSDFFDKNLEGFKKIDEGDGERFIYAQSCYFEESLCDEDGQYRYKV